MTNSYYNHIYEEFEMYYGSDVNRVVKWEPSGKREIVVYYEDGIRVRYDSMTRTAYSIHPRKSDEEFISDDVYAKRFSWKLRAVLNSSGLSRDEICERTGISNAALSGYVNGKQFPTAPRIIKLAKVLKCPFEELLSVDEWDK